MSLLSELASLSCPYCGEPIELIVDTSVEQQTYIEDCQVCCQPMTVIVTIGSGGPFVEARHQDDA